MIITALAVGFLPAAAALLTATVLVATTESPAVLAAVARSPRRWFAWPRPGWPRDITVECGECDGKGCAKCNYSGTVTIVED